jgi:hypothetical protein
MQKHYTCHIMILQEERYNLGAPPQCTQLSLSVQMLRKKSLLLIYQSTHTNTPSTNHMTPRLN